MGLILLRRLGAVASNNAKTTMTTVLGVQLGGPIVPGSDLPNRERHQPHREAPSRKVNGVACYGPIIGQLPCERRTLTVPLPSWRIMDG